MTTMAKSVIPIPMPALAPADRSLFESGVVLDVEALDDVGGGDDDGGGLVVFGGADAGVEPGVAEVLEREVYTAVKALICKRSVPSLAPVVGYIEPVLLNEYAQKTSGFWSEISDLVSPSMYSPWRMSL